MARSRAVEKTGQTIALLLTEARDEQAAKRLLTKAIRRHGLPEKITIDGSAAHEAAIKSSNKEHGPSIASRRGKYLNNLVEQDHRAVQRVTRPMLGFKAFEVAHNTLVGIARMHRIKKTQLMSETGEEGLTAAEQFSALASSSLCLTGCTHPKVSTHKNLRHNHMDTVRGLQGLVKADASAVCLSRATL